VFASKEFAFEQEIRLAADALVFGVLVLERDVYADAGGQRSNATERGRRGVAHDAFVDLLRANALT
jgi:hypothetical protein